MTDAAYTPALRPARAHPLSLFRHEPLMAATGLLLLLSLAVTLPALALDPRLFQGESVWVKPIKFQIALALYTLTLAWAARWVPQGLLDSRAYRVFAGVAVFAIAGEVAWIAGAAMFGTASHFNVGTPVMQALYGLMGLFAVTLTSVSLVYGVALWRAGRADPFRLSLALGLILTFVLTVIVAGTMSSMPGHHIGTPVTGETLALMGWSREVGDLRVAHFLATHALHGLPLVGWLAGRALAAGPARAVVWAASGAYAALVLGTFAQALMGLPLI